MGLTLYLTDGTNQVTFTLSPWRVIEYTPSSPSRRKEQINSSLAHGQHVYAERYNNVTETLTLLLQPSDTAAAETQIEKIERLLEQAAMKQELDAVAIQRVYLYYQPEDVNGVIASVPVYRSEIFGGIVELDADAYRDYWSRGAQVVLLHIERAYYWEHSVLQELPLSNGNGTNVTGGITVYNHDDGDAGHDNWVQVNSSDIKGSIMSPVILTMKNTSASCAYPICDMYVGSNWASNPANFKTWYDAPGDTYSRLTYTTLSDPSYSGGTAQQWTLTSAQYGADEIVRAELDQNQVAYAGGRYFRVKARVQNQTTGHALHIFAELRTNLGWVQTAIQPTIVLPDGFDGLVDLGIFRIPAGNLGSGSYTPVIHDINIWCGPEDGTTTMTLTIDYVEVIPLDGYKHFYLFRDSSEDWNCLFPDGAGLRPGNTLGWDGIEDTAYIDWTLGVRDFGVAPEGTPLLVKPNNAHRFYFQANPYDITTTLQVQAWYRPRVLTI